MPVRLRSPEATTGKDLGRLSDSSDGMKGKTSGLKKQGAVRAKKRRIPSSSESETSSSSDTPARPVLKDTGKGPISKNQVSESESETSSESGDSSTEEAEEEDDESSSESDESSPVSDESSDSSS
jgi:hypothetical protein